MWKLKTQIVTKPKSLKMWQNAKTQNVTKIKKLKIWRNSKFWNVIKLNLKCDKTKKLKVWHNSNCDKNQIVTISTQKLKLWKIQKTEHVTISKT